ncbi:MAG TPA: hypothetical protein VGB82_28255 [Alphaproteobacteria bacterium]
MQPAVSQTPEMQARFAEMGLIPINNTPEEARDLFRREFLVWKDVIEKADIRLE